MVERVNSPEARDAASVVHGLSDLKKHSEEGPFLIDRGAGVRVTDVEGKSYIEGMSGLWCASLGYGEARLMKAAARQMDKLPYAHLTNHMGHLPVIELAEELLRIAPVPMARVWFSNSGSEGNDSAIRLVWYYWDARGEPGRTKIISHDRSYHGNTIATASLSGMGYSQAGFNLPLPGFLKIACPDYYRLAEPGESEVAFADRLVDDLEGLIVAEGPETIGAFFTEPILAAGGVVVPPDTYFTKLQAVLEKYDILLIADEVVTGLGRTGKLFGSTAMGLDPDMIVCAKGLSGAYFPISALMVNGRIFETMLAQSERRGIFGLTLTYSGHPVGAAVAREALRIYDERDIVGHVRAMEPHFLGGLRALSDHPLVGDVRGAGLLAGVELIQDKQARTAFDPAAKVGAYCAAKAQQHGLLVRAIGDTIAFCPPLIIDEAETQEVIECFAAALDDTAAWVS